MFYSTKNIALRSLQILYIVVSRKENINNFHDNFSSKMVTFTTRIIYTKFANFARLYFWYFKTFRHQTLQCYGMLHLIDWKT